MTSDIVQRSMEFLNSHFFLWFCILMLSYLTSVQAVVSLAWILCKVPIYIVHALFRAFFPLFFCKDVSGDTVLISGAAGGIGKLMALEFARLGSKNIILVDINETMLKKAKTEVSKITKTKKNKVSMYVVDLSKEEATVSAMQRIISENGPVTILINNAGIVTGRTLTDAPPELMKLTMAVNIEAHFWTVKAVLPSMIEANKGHICTVASSTGILGVPGLADYCASKHAAVGFDESIRLELRDLKCSGVRTTCVCPFIIDTGMFEGAQSKFPRLIPHLQPDYVASQIVSAIRCDQEVLYLPAAVHLINVARLLPTPIFDELTEWFGVNDTMKGFKGSKMKGN